MHCSTYIETEIGVPDTRHSDELCSHCITLPSDPLPSPKAVPSSSPLLLSFRFFSFKGLSGAHEQYISMMLCVPHHHLPVMTPVSSQDPMVVDISFSVA